MTLLRLTEWGSSDWLNEVPQIDWMRFLRMTEWGSSEWLNEVPQIDWMRFLRLRTEGITCLCAVLVLCFHRVSSRAGSFRASLSSWSREGSILDPAAHSVSWLCSPLLHPLLHPGLPLLLQDHRYSHPPSLPVLLFSVWSLLLSHCLYSFSLSGLSSSLTACTPFLCLVSPPLSLSALLFSVSHSLTSSSHTNSQGLTLITNWFAKT